MYLLVYVDDIFLTDIIEYVLKAFTHRLNREFAIKDLGDLNNFLGLEVSYTYDGLFLSQSKYVIDILTYTDFVDSKPVPTPLSTHDTFTSEGTPYKEATLYRSLVGALQYLTIACPDLSYVINQASQFIQTRIDARF